MLPVEVVVRNMQQRLGLTIPIRKQLKRLAAHVHVRSDAEQPPTLRQPADLSADFVIGRVRRDFKFLVDPNQRDHFMCHILALAKYDADFRRVFLDRAVRRVVHLEDQS